MTIADLETLICRDLIHIKAAGVLLVAFVVFMWWEGRRAR